MRKSLLFSVFGALVVLLALLAVHLWSRAGDVEISLHGFLAMGLGIAFSLALWIGLMSLVYFSNRRGYDAWQQDDNSVD